MKGTKLSKAANGQFRIGYEGDFAPLTFVRDGMPAGLVVEILSLAFTRAGHDAEFLPVPLPDQDRALHSNEVDAIAFKAVIPDRAGVLDFSAALTTSGGAWFSKCGVTIEDRPDVGASVATPPAGPLLAQLRRDYPDLVFPHVATYADALSAVINGSADCAALNFHVGCYLANRDHAGQFALPQRPFSPLPLALAVTKGLHGHVRMEIDAVLVELRANGALGEVEARWIGI